MRPISVEQDALRYPLNDLLSTPANVRLLRFLTEGSEGPVGAAEAARRTGLTEAGARRALSRLAKTGFVQRVGGGRYQQFELRRGDPLTERLEELFRSEDDRYRSFLARLRNVLAELHEVRTAWIDSSPSKPGQPLHIGVLSDSRSLVYLGGEIRKRIEEIETDFDTTVEVHAFSRADVPELNWGDVHFLAGHPDSVLSEGPQGSVRHDDRDRRAARLSQAISGLLERDPTLIKRAARHVEVLLQEGQGMASHDLEEWGSILSRYSRQRIMEFLVSNTPRAQRLRQSSPFFAVLTGDERDEVLRSMEN
jgi:IclR-like helix-turn-helix domain-containing protein